jgi:hypothetical protein
MKNAVRIIIGKVWSVRIVLKQRSMCFGHWPELHHFLSSYGGNPGNEGNYLLLHRVFWRMKKETCDKRASGEK